MNEVKMSREWLTYAEAQELTHLGRTTLWTIISKNDVKATRVGRAVRINRASLEEYLERNSYSGRGV